VNLTGKDLLQKRIERTSWILVAVLFSGSLLIDQPRFSLGILCGGLISVVNFHWLYRNLVSVFTKEVHRVRAALMVRFSIRLAVTALVLFLVISRSLVDVIGLVIGLSIVVLSIVITITAMSKNCIGEV
jgi:hypothetical protein